MFTLKAAPLWVKPVPAVTDEEGTHVPFKAKHPPLRLTPTFDVDVAKPEMFKPRTVVVPKPVPEISRAEIEVVATEVEEDVAR